MPFEDFVVCDSDMHVLEPADLWQRYIADEFKHAAPVGMTEKAKEFVSSGSEIYHGNLPDGAGHDH